MKKKNKLTSEEIEIIKKDGKKALIGVLIGLIIYIVILCLKLNSVL